MRTRAALQACGVTAENTEEDPPPPRFWRPKGPEAQCEDLEAAVAEEDPWIGLGPWDDFVWPVIF